MKGYDKAAVSKIWVAVYADLDVDTFTLAWCTSLKRR